MAAAVPVLWINWIGPSDVLVFAVMYAASGFGVTVGFHRMLTYRASGVLEVALREARLRLTETAGLPDEEEQDTCQASLWSPRATARPTTETFFSPIEEHFN
jgi:hypothetical protein